LAQAVAALREQLGIADRRIDELQAPPADRAADRPPPVVAKVVPVNSKHSEL
jgi:hypothetical protein